MDLKGRFDRVRHGTSHTSESTRYSYGLGKLTIVYGDDTGHGP